MRKIMFVLLMMVSAVTANAQHALESGKEYPVYVDVMGYNFWGIGKVKVILDFGTSAKNECSLFDETGKKIKFNTMMEVLNYMSKRGWVVKDTYYVTASPSQHVLHFLLTKNVTDDSQIYEGLTVQKYEK